METYAPNGIEGIANEQPGPAGIPRPELEPRTEPETETVHVSPDTARQLRYIQDEFGLTETVVADFLVRFAVFAHDDLPAANDNPGELTAQTPF